MNSKKLQYLLVQVLNTMPYPAAAPPFISSPPGVDKFLFPLPRQDMTASGAPLSSGILSAQRKGPPYKEIRLIRPHYVIPGMVGVGID